MGVPLEPEKPAWVAEVTVLLRAVSLQTAHKPTPGSQGPRGVWSPRAQGNGSGTAQRGPCRPQLHLQPHPSPQCYFLKLPY